MILLEFGLTCWCFQSVLQSVGTSLFDVISQCRKYKPSIYCFFYIYAENLNNRLLFLFPLSSPSYLICATNAELPCLPDLLSTMFFRCLLYFIGELVISLDTVERYDPEQNSWKMMHSMTKVRLLLLKYGLKPLIQLHSMKNR